VYVNRPGPISKVPRDAEGAPSAWRRLRTLQIAIDNPPLNTFLVETGIVGKIRKVRSPIRYWDTTQFQKCVIAHGSNLWCQRVVPNECRQKAANTFVIAFRII